MHSKEQFPHVIVHAGPRQENTALAIMRMLPTVMFVFLFMTLTSPIAQGQTYRVLHSFTGAADGAGPVQGLTMDSAGNLYGTTPGGGTGYGTVFKLRRVGSSWIFTPLYSFQGGTDGAYPQGGVVLGPDGNLYGTTFGGGPWACGGFGCGTVFKLTPPPNPPRSIHGNWAETVLYSFRGSPDGFNPSGPVTFDNAGNIYLAAPFGGQNYCGGIVELTPSGGGWTESVVYSFHGSDGVSPEGGLIFDGSGNLYGTTALGGNYESPCQASCGTVFQLQPSGSGWTETFYALHGSSDGGSPRAGLMLDQSGNLYGATTSFGLGNGGTVFEITPSSGPWTFTVLHSFTGTGPGGPGASLTMDPAGNLYGTLFAGGAYGLGSVFKMTPSGDGWTYTSLHDFARSDGSNPYSTVVFDATGNLYGTTVYGGTYDDGVVWQITP